MMPEVVMFATSHRRYTTTFAGLGLVGACLLSACSGAGNGTDAPPPGAGRGGGAPIAVVVAPVVAKPMPVRVRSVGNVEASSTVEVRAQVTGELQSVNFEEGRDVKAGQLLFTIDPRTFEATVKQVEATLARSKAQAQNLEAQKRAPRICRAIRRNETGTKKKKKKKTFVMMIVTILSVPNREERATPRRSQSSPAF